MIEKILLTMLTIIFFGWFAVLGGFMAYAFMTHSTFAFWGLLLLTLAHVLTLARVVIKKVDNE